MSKRIQSLEFDIEVEELLMTNQLPVDDMRDSSCILLFGCRIGNQLAGLIGLELYAPFALLRSLVVADDERRNKLGATLVKYAEQYAMSHGVKAVYLLTNTGEKYFERHGYKSLSRQEAPKIITATRQFSELCPASSVFMAKQL